MSTPDAMIGPAFAQTMAAYNAVMNARVYAAADTLTDTQRRQDRGAFWRSIHGTLAHVLWADRMWLSRFGVGERPSVGIAESAAWAPDWAALRAMRAAQDTTLTGWASGLTAADLAGELRWFSGALGREMTTPRALCVAHLFNHQTHHRGQAHALLTALGAVVGDTDLPFVLPMAD